MVYNCKLFGLNILNKLNQPRLFRTSLRKWMQSQFGEMWNMVEDTVLWVIRIIFHLIGNYFFLKPIFEKYFTKLPCYIGSRIMRFIYLQLIFGYIWKVIHPIFDIIIPPPIEPEDKGIFVNLIMALVQNEELE